MILNMLGLGILLSQFYIFSSGIPQPAHYLIALALISFLMARRRIVVPKSGSFALKCLFAFVVYQAIVNFVYFAGTLNYEFLMQLIYIAYGFSVFVLIINLFLVEKDVLRKISFFCLLGLSTLLVLPLLGLGEYKFSPRYNAFFNDPNQMAFWVLCVAAICIYYYGKSGNSTLTVLVFFGAGTLIFLTASRSGLIGFCAMAFGYFLNYVKGVSNGLDIKKIVAYLLAFGMIAVGSYNLLNSQTEAISFLLARLDIGDASDQAEIRGYTRILEYPERIIFGAGHGMEGRFDAMETEIHSTWAGILFYYGLPGFSLFLIILFSISKKLDLNEKLLFLAPLLYSFSTFGLRTPIFWVFLAFFYSVVLMKKDYAKSNTPRSFSCN